MTENVSGAACSQPATRMRVNMTLYTMGINFILPNDTLSLIII